MKKIKKWMMKENRWFSRLLGCKVINLSAVGTVMAIVLFAAAFALSNSSVEEESRLAQGIMSALATLAMVPVIMDVKDDNCL